MPIDFLEDTPTIDFIPDEEQPRDIPDWMQAGGMPSDERPIASPLGGGLKAEPMEMVTKPIVELPRLDIDREKDTFLSALSKESLNQLAGIPEFFTSKLGVTALSAGTALPRLVAGLFTADIAKSIYEEGKQVIPNWDSLTDAEKGRSVASIGAKVLMGGMTGRTTVKGHPQFIKDIIEQPAPRQFPWSKEPVSTTPIGPYFEPTVKVPEIPRAQGPVFEPAAGPVEIPKVVVPEPPRAQPPVEPFPKTTATVGEQIGKAVGEAAQAAAPLAEQAKQKTEEPSILAPEKTDMPTEPWEVPLFYGDFYGKLTTDIPISKFGDYGKGTYLTPDIEFASRFAKGSAFDTQKRGSGKVHSVESPKPEKLFRADDTPLTKDEISWWENDGYDIIDQGIVTRRDLADNYGGRNYQSFELREISDAWDDFLDKFEYDSVFDGEQLVLRKGGVKIKPTEAPGVESVRAGPGAAAPADVAAESAAQAAGVRTAEYINKSLEQKDIPTQPDIPVAESELKMSDPQVEQRWNAAKLTTPSWTEKAKGIADAAYRSATRHFRHLDPKEDGVLIDTLRVHENDPLFAKFQASQVLRGITDGLKPKKYDVFSRIAILRDLAKYGERFGQELEDLPFGYKSWDAVKQDLGKFEALAEKYPDIKESLKRRDEFMDALRYDLVARDLLPETVKDFGEYFHHQVLEYMRLKEPYASTGSKDVRTHKKGWQKQRVGSAKDYNTDYLESEFEVISQSFAQMATQDVLKQLKRTADISDQLKIAAKEAKAEGQDVSWQQLIPDGYTLWQPEKGNHFYWANSITDKALDAYFMKQKDISPADIKEVMAMGGKREQWVIPERLAKTLDEFTPPKDHPIEKAVGIGLSNWKRWTLFNPMRNVIYELNNFSGDADIAFAVDPKIFKHAPQAAKEVAKFVRAKEGASKEMSDLVRLGVIDSGFSVQELPDLKGNQFFRVLQGKDPTLTQRYWENILDFNRWREGVLRLASYRRALELLNEGKRPLWTSKRSEMEALYRDPNVTREQVAAKLAREAIGDYGNISHAGQWIRAKLIPFYSWMEINSPRYVRLIKNVSAEEGAAGATGRVAAVAGKKVASQAAKLSLRMGAFYILANLWNKTFFPEEDRELNTTKDQFHVILKRNEDGTITSIRLQGALSDALSWFGAEDLVKDIQDVREQRASVQDKAVEMAKAPVNKLVQASWPLYKSGFEAIVKRQTFPDVFNPRPIRDPKQHLARVVSMGSIYDYLASKPQRPGTWSLKALATYTTDPGEAAYMTSRSIVEDKLKELNEPRGQFDATERSNALYYLKQSIRYKNEKLQEYWTKRYMELGGNPKYINRSIEAMDPWKFAPTKVRGQIQSMLSPAEKEIMDRASEWYRKVYVEER